VTSDWQAIKQSSWDLPGIVTKLGLISRMIIGVDFSKTDLENPTKIGKLLQHYVMNEPFWQKQMYKYGLEWTEINSVKNPLNGYSSAEEVPWDVDSTSSEYVCL